MAKKNVFRNVVSFSDDSLVIRYSDGSAGKYSEAGDGLKRLAKYLVLTEETMNSVLVEASCFSRDTEKMGFDICKFMQKLETYYEVLWDTEG